MAELRDLLRSEWQFAYYPRFQLWWAGKCSQEEQEGSFRVLVHNTTQVKQYTHTPLTHKFYSILLLLRWLILCNYVLIILRPSHAWHCIHNLVQPLFCIWRTDRAWRKWGLCYHTALAGEVMMCKIASSTACLEMMHSHWVILREGRPELKSSFPLSEDTEQQIFCLGLVAGCYPGLQLHQD